MAAGPAWTRFVEPLADGYPNRPLHIIVAFGAGGGSDQLARAMADALEEVANVPSRVINRPAHGGLEAMRIFMEQPPDGYTLLVMTEGAAANYSRGNLEYHPTQDWSPVAVAQITFSQLYVRAKDLRFSNWQRFLETANGSRNGLSIAYVGNPGSMEDILIRKLADLTGASFRRFPFDQPQRRYQALLDGEVDLLIEQPGDVRNMMDEGSIRPLFSFLPERPQAFDQVPAMGDVGMAGEPLLRFRSFFAGRSVPEKRLAWLEQALRAAWQSEAFQSFNRSKYMDVIESYRDRAGAEQLLEEAILTYRSYPPQSE